VPGLPTHLLDTFPELSVLFLSALPRLPLLLRPALLPFPEPFSIPFPSLAAKLLLAPPLFSNPIPVFRSVLETAHSPKEHLGIPSTFDPSFDGKPAHPDLSRRNGSHSLSR
jgi:hypothetical protein